jgi:hypothetical protein
LISHISPRSLISLVEEANPQKTTVLFYSCSLEPSLIRCDEPRRGKAVHVSVVHVHPWYYVSVFVKSSMKIFWSLPWYLLLRRKYGWACLTRPHAKRLTRRGTVVICRVKMRSVLIHIPGGNARRRCEHDSQIWPVSFGIDSRVSLVSGWTKGLIVDYKRGGGGMRTHLVASNK